MKLRIISILALAILPVFAFVATANAQTFRTGESTVIESREAIDGSAWVAGTDVDVAGEVDGDLFCAGQNITISGTVNGDVLCTGQTIKITGTVTGDVRTAGQTVSVNGDVQGSLSAMGQTVTLERGAFVGRDVSFVGQSLRIDGQVGRDVILGGATAVVASDIERNLVATVDSLSLTDSANIGGDVEYTSPQKFTRSDSAVIDGEITYNEAMRDQVAAPILGLGFVLLWALMMLFGALIIALLFPRALQKTTDASAQSFPNVLLAVGVGLVAGIVMPFILLLILLTIIGIPLAIVLGVAWLLIVLLSGAVTAYYLGRVAWQSQHNAIITMLFGAMLLILLLLIPILNILVYLFAVWYGIGAILLQLKKSFATPHYDMQTATPNGSAPRAKKKDK